MKKGIISFGVLFAIVFFTCIIFAQTPPPASPVFDVPENPASVVQMVPTPATGDSVRGYNNMAFTKDGKHFVADVMIMNSTDMYLVYRDPADPTAPDLDILDPVGHLQADITDWNCDLDNPKVIYPRWIEDTNRFCTDAPAPGQEPCNLSYVTPGGSMKDAPLGYLSVSDRHLNSPSTVCDRRTDKEYLLYVQRGYGVNDDKSDICIIEYDIGSVPDIANRKCITNQPVGCLISTARLEPSPDFDRVAVKCVTNARTDILVISGVRDIMNGVTAPVTALDIVGGNIDSRVILVAANAGNGSQPTWSLDGDYIFYVVENLSGEVDTRGQALPMGVNSIRIKKSDGTGNAQAFNASQNSQNWLVYSTRGWLCYAEDTNGDNANELFCAPVVSRNECGIEGCIARDLNSSQMTVPAAAVDASTTFTLEAPAPGEDPGGTMPTGATGTDVIRELNATDAAATAVTSFSGDLEIQIKYEDEDLIDAGITDESKLDIYVLNTSTDGWETVKDAAGTVMPPTVDATNNTVTVSTNHLSTYKVVSADTDDDGGGGGGSGGDTSSSSSCSLTVASSGSFGILAFIALSVGTLAARRFRRK